MLASSGEFWALLAQPLELKASGVALGGGEPQDSGQGSKLPSPGASTDALGKVDAHLPFPQICLREKWVPHP